MDKDTLLSAKILTSGVLSEPEKYTLRNLFTIRDLTEGLLDYFPYEKWLLDLHSETVKFIAQKVGE